MDISTPARVSAGTADHATVLRVRILAVVLGATAMWLGAAWQATGVAGWASAYYYATDPDVSAAATSTAGHVRRAAAGAA